MESLIITIHIIACIFLVILVLLQSGKEGMGVIFGGGSGTMFGGGGAGGFLAKLTTGVAVVFFCTSLAFTYLSAKKHIAPKASVVLDQAPVKSQSNAGQSQAQTKPKSKAEKK